MSATVAATLREDGGLSDVVLAGPKGNVLTRVVMERLGALSYALGVKNTFTMNVEFYTGVDSRLEAPLILPPVPDPVDLRATRVLIADDVADTGATLELVKRFCEGHVADARCAVLYEKPRSLVRCEYAWRHTDRWITFPWSALPPVVGGDAVLGLRAPAAERRGAGAFDRGRDRGGHRWEQ